MKKSMKTIATLLVFGTIAMIASAVPAGQDPKQTVVVAATININTASMDELSTLNGIGTKYAERIIEYRKKNGPFKQVEDVVNVPGIGKKTLDANKGVLTVK